MDTNNLKAFVEVAGKASFSRASESLYLTQPAISKRIAALESELDVKLFDRIGRRVQLTEAGRRLLPRARDLLSSAEDLQRIAANVDEEISGPLTFATSHHIGLHRLPPLLRQFVKSYARVNLDMRFMDSEDACKAVESGELELAIVTLPQTPSAALVLEPVWPDPLSVMVNHEHELVGRKSVSLQQLASFPAVVPGIGTYTRALLEARLRPANIELQIAMSSNYLETLRMLAEIGLGWTLLPDSMLNDQLLQVPVRGLRIKRRLGLVMHRKRTLSRAADALRDLCLTQGDSR
ncbi:MAG: LysR family transcriptional regulator [Chromatiales bacterium]|jgi:DNA-binding transcriptional LysR family regulator